MMMRPTTARPAEGLFVGSPRAQTSPTKENLYERSYAKAKQQQQQQQAPYQQPHDTYLPSPEDEFIACELDRLADESKMDDILLQGFLNGSSCLRMSLSPRGVLRNSVCDFETFNVNPQEQNSLMDLFKRNNRNARGALVITSDD